jgi:tripartite motif-containing protein 71
VVLYFDSSGGYLGTIGTVGLGAGEYANPYGLAIDGATHTLFVVDTGNNQIDAFSTSGTFRGEIAAPHVADSQDLLRGVAVAPGGALYVTGLEDRFVRVFAPPPACEDSTLATPHNRAVTIRLRCDDLAA